MRYPELIKKSQNKPLMQDYCQWVEDNGHITAFSSSVLEGFVKEQEYSQKEYDFLAKEMGF